VDETKANMLGLEDGELPDLRSSIIVSQEPLRVNGRIRSRTGARTTLAGYHPLFMARKCVLRLCPPALLTGAWAWLRLCVELSETRTAGGETGPYQYVRRQQLPQALGA